jgi:hypothetical protein
VASGNVFSLPFSVQVINPVQRVSILRQPMGTVSTGVALTVQPRLSIASFGPSIVGQMVRAASDPSCTSGAVLLFDTCTILADLTCEFRELSVSGIFQEVKYCRAVSFLYGFVILCPCRVSKRFASVLPYLESHPKFHSQSM